MQKKVLIVEDNDNNMLLMRCILESSGIDVIEAKTGLEGIQQAHKNEADLIIMDIHLPDFSGINVTQKIREFNQDIPIVAITACALPGDKEKAIKAGFTKYLTKPIDPNRIDSEIAQFFTTDPPS